MRCPHCQEYTLDDKEIGEIAEQVKSRLLRVSTELSEFFEHSTIETMQMAINPQRSATENLHLEIHVTEGSIIVTFWAWGYVILDRFIFARPPLKDM